MHMSKRTKKVGSSGRLGARYGVRIRKRIADVELQSKGRHECPKCKAVALGRTASGIWACRHCGAEFASSSYMPTPPAAVRREVSEVMAIAKIKEAGAEEMPEESELLPEAEEKADKHKKASKE
jgi:large subunit ribosomal protein L37Ae